MNRRNFLQFAASASALGALATAGCAQSLQPAGESAALRPSSALAPVNYGPRDPKLAGKPNIVFIVADDLGYFDLGCYGSSFYDTPNLDKLAQAGALFTDAYAACPVCSPTRASILTGQYPQRTGVTDYIGAPQPTGWQKARNTKMLPAPYTKQLDLEKVTMAEMLKTQGYATGFFGKWHLGDEGFWPEDQGFDVNQGGISRGGPYGGKKYFSPYDNPRLSDGPDGEHLPDRLGTEVCKFMEGNREKPFLAYLAFYSVHTPLMARPDLQAKYEGRVKERGLVTKWGKARGIGIDVRESQDHAIYAGMVEAMDQAAGKVLDKLQELGLEEDTIVVFTSDNGGLSTAEGWPTSNLPLRGGKGWLYEGGIREPLLVRWPGVATAGSKVTVPVNSPDFFKTFMVATGAQPPVNQPLDGIDLKPVLQGKAVADRPLFWEYPHYGNQGGAPGVVVRSGNWKFIEWSEGETELFDLSKDIGENVNLAAREPARVRQMSALIRDWRREVGAKSATVNPSYDPAKPDARLTGRPRELRGK